jgi:hypothetical protein
MTDNAKMENQKKKMHKLSLMRKNTSKFNINKAYFADLMIEVLKDKYVWDDCKKQEEN